MTKQLIARINPVTLVWAREVLGMPLEVAASKIGVTVDRLRFFESGTDLPTVIQLRKIGRVYRKPAAFFYQTVLPNKPERLNDFRTLPEFSSEQSPELLDAVMRAQERRMDAIDLAVMLNRPIPDFGVIATPGTPSEELASNIRMRLGIDLDTQQTWRNPYGALRSWIDAVERSGVLVIQFSNIDIQEARGFSIGDRPYPVIALNGSDWPRAKIFTIFHELAHIAFGASGVCDLHDETQGAYSFEPLCNHVAGEVLVPARALLADPHVARHSSQIWEDSILNDIASRFAVSQEVVLRRLLELGRTTIEFYNMKRIEFIQAAEATREIERGYLEYFRRILRDNGNTFTGLVLEAYRSEVISSMDLSRLLGGINLKHLDSIENALYAR